MFPRVNHSLKVKDKSRIYTMKIYKQKKKCVMYFMTSTIPQKRIDNSILER